MYWNWERTIIVVILIVGALQMYRANHQGAVQAEIVTPLPSYTYGNIVDADIEIPPANFISYEIRLNRTAKLVGRFWTADQKVSVECVVVRADDLEKWKSGESTPTLVSTGRTPGGQTFRQLEPENYYLVISNRRGDKTAAVHVDMSIE
ncbi:MAG: hypothetical protein ACR2IH_12905 [Pyrinomonadaceae bacterium]